MTPGQLVVGAAANALLARCVQRLLPRRSGGIPLPGGDPPGPPSQLDRVAAAVVIGAALIVLIVTFGGCVGALNDRIATLGITAALWLLVEVATRGADRTPAGAAPTRRDAPDGDGALWIATAAVAAVWIPLLCERLTLPPVAWDALTYHLRFPGLWLQTGHLTTAAAPEGDPSHTYYPLVGEMLLYWGLFSTGTDLWSSLSQVPFALAGAAALASLASRCGAGKRWAALAALGWLATPGVVRQGVEAMVDVEQAALVLLLLLFAVRWREGGGRSWLYLAAASLGLLVGAKYSGLVYAAATVPFLVWAARGAGHRARAASSRRTGPGEWVAATSLLLALGGYAYLRNLVAGGNPLLPLELKIGGATLLQGPTASAYYFGPQSPRLSWASFLVSPRSVLEMGPLFLPLLLALPTAVLVGARRGSEAGALSAWLAGVGLVALLLGGAVLPYREHRYFHAVVALGWCSAAGLGAGRLQDFRARWAVSLLLLAELPITLFYWGKDLLVAGSRPGDWIAMPAALAAAFLLLAPRARRRLLSSIARVRPTMRTLPGRPVIAAAAVVPALALLGAVYEPFKYDLWLRYWSTRHEWENLKEARPDLRDMAASWQFLAKRDAADSLAVAYVGMNAPYPLMGPGLRHRVLFVPRNSRVAASFYDWGSPAPDPLTGGNREDWTRNVGRLGVSYLCVYRRTAGLDPETRYPVEREWADSDRERFEPIWEAPWARIYRVSERGAGP